MNRVGFSLNFKVSKSSRLNSLLCVESPSRMRVLVTGQSIIFHLKGFLMDLKKDPKFNIAEPYLEP